jgi:transcriptional regulator with XRE-family HTH domain
MEGRSVIAKRLREARLRSGLSQKTLGIKAGIDEFSASPRVNQYETAKHTPDYSTVERLAGVLGVPTPFFYTREDWLAEVILLVAALPTAKRRRLIELIEK